MKNTSLILGGLSLLYGLYLFINPISSVATIAWLLALMIFGTGLGMTLTYVRSSGYHRSIWQLAQGLTSLIFGFFLLTSSIFSRAAVLMTILAYWVLVAGLTRLLFGLQLRRSGLASHSILGSAVLMLLLGLFLLGAPIFSAAIIGRLISLVFLVLGAFLLSFCWRLP